MIHVVAYITAASGQRAALMGHFLEIVAEVRKEPGCLGYRLAVDASIDHIMPSPSKLDADSFVVFEVWQDASALELHLSSTHMVAFREMAGHLIAGARAYPFESAD